MRQGSIRLRSGLPPRGRKFLRSQAETLLAADFIETVTLTGTRLYVLAVVEHASRFADAGIHVVLSGVRMPRMNAVMERWVQTCLRELLDRILIFNQRRLLYLLGWHFRQVQGHIEGALARRRDLLGCGVAGAGQRSRLPDPRSLSAALNPCRFAR